LVLFPDDNHEKLRALEGGCLSWNLKKAYIDNYFRGKSRESQGLRGKLPSLAINETLY
jgi:hypothetical protein